jgi:CelD/BcsL family acetyltransferase involved in cellulose biosynthesis
MIDIECVNREDAFLGLKRDWGELWESSPTRSFFLTHDWIRSCWKELQASHELRVFVVRESGKPVLCAPLMKSRRVQKRLPVDCLTFIEHPEAQTADILFSTSDQNSQPFVCFLQFLIKQRAADWHLILLDKISEGSPTIRLLADAANSCMSRYECKPSHAALFIPLSNDWETYLNSRSVRFRKTLRNVINRIERLGTIQVNCYQQSELTNSVIQKMFSISDASWKVADGVAMTSQRSRMTFFEDLLSDHQGDAYVWLLELDGTAIASEIQVVDRTTVYALRSDYDERYADSSPGVYLQVEILKRLFGSAYQQYNLGVGLNPYKTRWSEHRVSLQNFLLYNKTIYSRLLQSVDHCNGKLRQVPALRTLQQFFLGRD